MALHDLTSLQKKAVACIMLAIANADGVITKEERMLLKTMEAFDIFSESEIEEAKHMSVDHCISIIRGFSYSDKKSLFEFLLGIGGVDGWQDEEAKMLMTVCKGADIPIPEELAKYF